MAVDHSPRRRPSLEARRAGLGAGRERLSAVGGPQRRAGGSGPLRAGRDRTVRRGGRPPRNQEPRRRAGGRRREPPGEPRCVVEARGSGRRAARRATAAGRRGPPPAQSARVPRRRPRGPRPRLHRQQFLPHAGDRPARRRRDDVHAGIRRLPRLLALSRGARDRPPPGPGADHELHRRRPPGRARGSRLPQGPSRRRGHGA